MADIHRKQEKSRGKDKEMKKSVLKLMLFVICLLFSAQTAKADVYIAPDRTVTVSGLTYGIWEEGSEPMAFLISSDVNTVGKEITIVSTIDNVSVRGVESRAFKQNKTLEKVTFQDGVEIINDNAFYGCSNLKEVSLPSTIQWLDEGAFTGCTNIERITIRGTSYDYQELDGVIYSKGGYGDNQYLSLNYYPSQKKDNRYIISKGMKYQTAFSDLLSGNQYVEEIVVMDNADYVAVDGVLFSSDMKTLYKYPAGRKDASYVIPDGVEKIGAGAFYNAQNLKKLTIPASVKEIAQHGSLDGYAFGTVSDPSETYGDCFRLNTELMVYCNGNTAVYDYAKRLKNSFSYEYYKSSKYGLNLDGVENLSPKKIESSWFGLAGEKYWYTGKTIESGVNEINEEFIMLEGIDYEVSYANNINIGTAKVTIRGLGYFTGTVTKTFTITAKINSVYAVGNLNYRITKSSLTDKGTVAVISPKTRSVKKVVIPGSVKIGGAIFKVTAIDAKAFANCKKLKTISIGSNITSVGKSAFLKCKKLDTVKIKAKKLKTIGKKALKGINKKAKIKVPKSKLKTYQKLLKGKGQAKSVKIMK